MMRSEKRLQRGRKTRDELQPEKDLSAFSARLCVQLFPLLVEDLFAQASRPTLDFCQTVGRPCFAQSLRFASLFFSFVLLSTWLLLC